MKISRCRRCGGSSRRRASGHVAGLPDVRDQMPKRFVAAAILLAALITARSGLGADHLPARLRRGPRHRLRAGGAERSHPRRRRPARSRGSVRQARALAAARRRRRFARQFPRSGRRPLARRPGRPRPAAAAGFHPAGNRDDLARSLHHRCGEAVHPLGQDRYRQPDRPLRSSRLPQRRRYRVPGASAVSGRWRKPASRTHSRLSGCRG